jgi:hypothetical protein
MGPRPNPKRQDGQSGRDREAVPLGSVLKSVEYYLKGSRQSLLAVQDVLEPLLPPELIGHVQATGVHGGVVTFAVPDAAGKCLLETVLRGKAFETLVKALPGMSLRKVRVVLA